MFGSFPPSPLVGLRLQVYSGLGADIVYGIITLIFPLDRPNLRESSRNLRLDSDSTEAIMGIFKEICETRVVGSRLQYLGMKQRLQQAISRGWVEPVPVMKPSRFSPDQEWFRDTKTGEIYRLDPPGERGGW